MSTTDIRFERPTLYPKQEAALFGDDRYGIVEASTKSGKTVGCIAWIVEKAFELGGPNRHFWWVAPVFPVTKIAFRRLKLFLDADLYEANATELTVTLVNGAVIWFKSGDKPDSLYGEDVYAAVIDEATRVKEEAWHAVRSTLTATEGPVRIIGNVKGRKNWAYRMARKAENGAVGMSYAKLTVWDAVEAGVFSSAEAADAKETLPAAVFRELYLAEPGTGDEPFFDTSRMGIVSSVPAGLRQARAWDFAVTEAKAGTDPDWTVGAKLGFDGRQSWVLDVVRFRGSPATVQKTVVRTAREDGRVCDQLFEEESGAAGKIMVDQFKTLLGGVEGAGRVYPAKVTGGKIVRAFHFASAANDGRVNVLEADWNDEFFAECDVFPDGDKDDQVDAAAYAFNHLAPNLKPRVRWL